MAILRLACLLLLIPLTGCRSVLNLPPPQETRGGFTVAVNVPGQPTAAQVFADVGAYARGRGFVRQGAPSAQPAPAPERYLSGKITLDVVYDAEHLSVVADLHSFSHQLGRKFIGEFYQGFRQQYGGSYGDEGVIVENENTDDTGSPLRGGGNRGKPGR